MVPSRSMVWRMVCRIIGSKPLFPAKRAISGLEPITVSAAGGPGTRAVCSDPGSGQVNSVVEGAAGVIGDGRVLAEGCSASGREVRTHGYGTGERFSFPRVLMRDRKGNIWIGNDRARVCCVSGRQLGTIHASRMPFQRSETNGPFGGS